MNTFKSKAKDACKKYMNKNIVIEPKPVAAFLSLNDIYYIYSRINGTSAFPNLMDGIYFQKFN